MKYVKIDDEKFYYEDVSSKYAKGGTIDKDKALKCLSILNEVFCKNGIFFIPMWGTLLGIIRDGDFIDHDDDLDFLMYKSDEKKLLHILPELKEKGIILCKQRKGQIYSFISSDGIDCDIDILSKAFFPYGLRYCMILEKFRPKYLFKEYKKIDFKGQTISVPKNPDEFLGYFYGSTWKTPIKGDRGHRPFPKWMIIEPLFLKFKRKFRWILVKKFGMHVDDYLE